MMLFSNGGHNYYNGFDDEENVDYYYSSSPSVDCTLSLGTPSTHSSGNDEKKRSSIISGFGWNILQSKHTSSPAPAPAFDRHRAGGDPLLARRCANCDTTSTPLWRNGPRGPKSLCNACGIRFKKEERRATAGSAGSTSSGGVDGSNWAVQPPQRIPCFPASSGYGSSNEYQFIEGHEDHHHHLHQYYQYYNHRHDSVDHTNYRPFLSWRFNGEAKSRA